MNSSLRDGKDNQESGHFSSVQLPDSLRDETSSSTRNNRRSILNVGSVLRVVRWVEGKDNRTILSQSIENEQGGWRLGRVKLPSIVATRLLTLYNAWNLTIWNELGEYIN